MITAIPVDAKHYWNRTVSANVWKKVWKVFQRLFLRHCDFTKLQSEPLSPNRLNLEQLWIFLEWCWIIFFDILWAKTKWVDLWCFYIIFYFFMLWTPPILEEISVHPYYIIFASLRSYREWHEHGHGQEPAHDHPTWKGILRIFHSQCCHLVTISEIFRNGWPIDRTLEWIL